MLFGPVSITRIRKIQTSTGGIVVTDIRMPLMDGYQFVKKVKEIKPDMKVFFMSAFLRYHFRTGLSLVKVDEYIEKPISLNDFIRMVKKHLLPL